MGRLVLCGTADRDLAAKAWRHIREVEELGGMAKAIEAGIPKLRIEEAAAKTQARIDSGQQSVIGVNKYRPEAKPIDVLKVDNSAVRRLQLDKLARLKRERDPAAVAAALDALTRGAGDKDGRAGNANLLALAIDAARAKATVGEISLALEKVFGRHRAEIKAISGVYRQEVGAMSNAVERVLRTVAEFEANGAAARASWSPRSARTATTAARKSSPRRSPISASTSISGRCSRRPPRPRARRWKTTSTSSGCPRSPPGT